MQISESVVNRSERLNINITPTRDFMISKRKPSLEIAEVQKNMRQNFAGISPKMMDHRMKASKKQVGKLCLNKNL